ncbi:choline-sulfatase [soil metagenome]
MGAMRPNVLLVVLDTARRDAFTPYGAPSSATPTIAQLAERGSAHTGVYAPACWTVPSHGSMFTGLLPRSAGLDHVGGTTPAAFRAALVAQQHRSLPAFLNGEGYATAGISANAWVHRRTGFDLGFDTFRSLNGHRHDGLTNDGFRHRARWYLDALRAHVDDGASLIEEQLGAWMTRRDHRPFFWFVNLVECHSPYLPPRPHHTLSALDRIRAATDVRRHLTLGGVWKAAVGGYDVTEAAMARMRALYAGAIQLMDAWLARVLQMLDDHGALDDTQVVITSDHGENLGEGCMLGHSFSLDDRLIRVPLVTAGPTALRAPPVTTLARLPALIAESVGIEDHPWAGDRPSDGVAVAQFDAPGTLGDDRVTAALHEWGLGADAERRLCTSFAAATDGNHKLVRRLGREELIDLQRDPLEEGPVIVGGPEERAHGGVLVRLRAALDDAEAAEIPRPATPEGTGPALDREEAAELEEQLRLLGYL